LLTRITYADGMIAKLWKPFVISLQIGVLLSACTSASLSMWGVAPVDITIGNSQFRIWADPGSGQVEAHRISVEMPPPGRREVLARGLRAIEQVTGCVVRAGSLAGDQAIMTAEIDCAG
jgi:hypothetical protein